MPKEYEVLEKDGSWGFIWGSEFHKLESEQMARDFAEYRRTYDELSREVGRKNAVEEMEFDHGKVYLVRRELEEMRTRYPNYHRSLISKHEDLLEKLETIIEVE